MNEDLLCQFNEYIRAGERLDLAYEIFKSPHGKQNLLMELGSEGVSATILRFYKNEMKDEAIEVFNMAKETFNDEQTDLIPKLITIIGLSE